MIVPEPDARPESSVDDATLVTRVLAGDTQEFARLVARYQGVLHRHAVAMVLDYDAAADMVQDAFVRAYTNLGACRDGSRFRAWLFQTLRNRCLDYLKDARRKNVRLDEAGEVADGAEGPAERAERRRLRGTLVRALAALPDAQREAFLMRYVEGHSYDTMAELLEASVSALKMRVLRAREALASALRHEEVTGATPVRLSTRGERVTRIEEARRRNMKGMIGAAWLAVALSAAPVLAQVQPSQDRISTAIARARQAGIPVALLESKVAEGKAKGVSPDRIAAAVERRLVALERANQALNGRPEIGPADLSVAADALESGVSEAVLRAIGSTTPRERRAVAIAALTELVALGHGPEAALERVQEALKRGPDALANLPAQAGAGRGSGSGNGNGPPGTPGSAGGRGASSPGPPASVPAPGEASQPTRPGGPPNGPNGRAAGRGAGRGGA